MSSANRKHNQQDARTAQWMERAEKMKERIDSDFKEFGYRHQMSRDVDVWKRTFQSPASQQSAQFLRRVFTVLRFCGVMYRRAREEPLESADVSHKTDCATCNNSWHCFSESNWPIAVLVCFFVTLVAVIFFFVFLQSASRVLNIVM